MRENGIRRAYHMRWDTRLVTLFGTKLHFFKVIDFFSCARLWLSYHRQSYVFYDFRCSGNQLSAVSTHLKLLKTLRRAQSRELTKSIMSKEFSKVGNSSVSIGIPVIKKSFTLKKWSLGVTRLVSHLVRSMYSGPKWQWFWHYSVNRCYFLWMAAIFASRVAQTLWNHQVSHGNRYCECRNDTMLRRSDQLLLTAENHHFEGSKHLKAKECETGVEHSGKSRNFVPSFAFEIWR